MSGPTALHSPGASGKEGSLAVKSLKIVIKGSYSKRPRERLFFVCGMCTGRENIEAVFGKLNSALGIISDVV